MNCVDPLAVRTLHVWLVPTERISAGAVPSWFLGNNDKMQNACLSLEYLSHFHSIFISSAHQNYWLSSSPHASSVFSVARISLRPTSFIAFCKSLVLSLPTTCGLLDWPLTEPNRWFVCRNRDHPGGIRLSKHFTLLTGGLICLEGS